jgi:hypothetical protein
VTTLFPGAKLMQVVEWGYPMGSLRPIPPPAKTYSVIHITANLATAENEAAWRIRDTALQNSATFFVNRDGSVVQLLGDPFRMDPWANGDVKTPDLTNPRIAQMVRDGVNANERTLVAIENVGNEIAWGSVPGGHPITPAQEETDARIIAYYHSQVGMPISRETVIGHYQLNSVNRANCPSRDKAIIDRIVARARAIANQEEDDVAVLRGSTPIFNRRAIIAAGATVRSSPAFDRTDYDGNALMRIGDSGSSAPAIAWVEGTNLTLVDGQVFDARTRWCAVLSAAGLGYVHERDVAELRPLEETTGGVPKADYDALQAQVAALTARISTKDAYVAQYPRG